MKHAGSFHTCGYKTLCRNTIQSFKAQMLSLQTNEAPDEQLLMEKHIWTQQPPSRKQLTRVFLNYDLQMLHVVGGEFNSTCLACSLLCLHPRVRQPQKKNGVGLSVFTYN
ncbi:hypothetical protein ILYODFUR_038926 [Ilyodon furcidens]|uniref:Uncharacterized protein n=1 Tax=Ilyodon furcidens TaxID=33524 RepID=A0ABV0T3V4_9TELE